jgi:hypothetical protein
MDKKVINFPDISHEKENEYRRKLLREFRGYGSNQYLFEDFPLDVKWERALLSKEELEKVLYIDWDYWTDVTKGTRLPKDFIKRIRSGELPEDKEILRLRKLVTALKKGAMFPELILVAEGINARLVALEGHVRLTAYSLAPEYVPDEIEVIIGYSKNMPQWGSY